MKNLLWITSIIVFTGVIAVFSGCKQEESSPPEQPQETEQGMQQPNLDMQEAMETAKETAAEQTEQKTCPVMGNPINKDIFVEYEGKKVYFCCPDCIEKFKENPEKYLSKLPQFQE